jgi:hypothetical protein
LACILAKPTKKSKGILSISTSELDQIMRNGYLVNEALEIKKSYYLGLHHNWHPVDFEISSDFDFHFLESKDAIFLKGNEPLLEMDACNFTPTCFSNTRNNPIWDVLIVGRTANFKRPFKTIETLRELFDKGHLLRTLWICPMDLEKPEDRSLVKAYESMFSQSEKELFTLLNPQANYPFTFSREELSFFYRSSRSFVHFADVETRCRVAAYAFCAGIPVIGNSVISNILPVEIATEPTFFEVKNDDYFSAILRAISEPMPTNQRECLNVLSASSSINRMVENMNRCINPPVEFVASQFFSSNLDIRLGAAHTGNSSSNSYGMDLVMFMKSLKETRANTIYETIVIDSTDPENEIEKILNKEKVLEDKVKTFSIKNGRSGEIKITRRGKLRFLLYRILKRTNDIPLIGARIRRVYILMKNN